MNNPNLWYALMVLDVLASLLVFMVGPALGYESLESARTVGIITAVWSVVFGILGLRAQLRRLERPTP
jgi:Na+-driven multidrug efflux pump